MPRKPGDRNRDYLGKRQAILDRLHRALTPPAGPPPSLRDLAYAAGVSVPVLKHYFGNRAAIIAAVMAHQGAEGRPYLAHLARADLPFAASIRAAVGFMAEGLFEARVSDIHAFGLAEGTQDGATGRAYLEHLFEPTLQALEARLAAHVARGEMKPAEPRLAALMLLAPLVLGALHQDHLGGDVVRPLDREALVAALVDSFCASHAAAAS